MSESKKTIDQMNGSELRDALQEYATGSSGAPEPRTEAQAREDKLRGAHFMLPGTNTADIDAETRAAVWREIQAAMGDLNS